MKSLTWEQRQAAWEHHEASILGLNTLAGAFAFLRDPPLPDTPERQLAMQFQFFIENDFAIPGSAKTEALFVYRDFLRRVEKELPPEQFRAAEARLTKAIGDSE